LKTSKFPSQEYLKACFSYNPLSGLLRWKKRPREHFKSDLAFHRFNALFADNHAGYKDDKGYISVYMDGKHLKAHRIIWMLVNGHYPKHQIDHINTIRSDNTIDNLREASHSQNQMNTNVYKTNKLGIKGVWFDVDKGRFRSKLRKKHLGSFKTIEEAKAAYDKAASAEYGDFARA
jgi:hypothetical protein